MRYNPKARLNQNQVEFKRGRVDSGGDGAHTFYDRFDDLTRNRRDDKAKAWSGQGRRMISRRSAMNSINRAESEERMAAIMRRMRKK